jgi:hypothetical protein
MKELSVSHVISINTGMKKEALNNKVNPTLLSFTEKRLINYLVGKTAIGKDGFCFVGSKRYLAIKALRQKGIIQITKEKNNVATFSFTKLYSNQVKLS